MSESVPPKVRDAVLRRDDYRCIAPLLDREAGWCKDRWDHPISRWIGRDPGGDKIEMSHTKDLDKPMMGKKAPMNPAHLVSLCPWHHRGTEAGSNWEARNRAKIRAYLERVR